MKNRPNFNTECRQEFAEDPSELGEQPSEIAADADIEQEAARRIDREQDALRRIREKNCSARRSSPFCPRLTLLSYDRRRPAGYRRTDCSEDRREASAHSPRGSAKTSAMTSASLKGGSATAAQRHPLTVAQPGASVDRDPHPSPWSMTSVAYDEPNLAACRGFRPTARKRSRVPAALLSRGRDRAIANRPARCRRSLPAATWLPHVALVRSSPRETRRCARPISARTLGGKDRGRSCSEASARWPRASRASSTNRHECDAARLGDRRSLAARSSPSSIKNSIWFA